MISEVMRRGTPYCFPLRVGRRDIINQTYDFHLPPRHASVVAIGHDPFGCAGSNIAWRFVLQLFKQLPLALHPLLDFVHCNGQALVLVVTAIPGLCGHVALTCCHKVTSGEVFVTGSRAPRLMNGFEARKTIRQLHVAVASQPDQEGRMIGVDIRVISRRCNEAHSVAFAFEGQAGLCCQCWANQPSFLRQLPLFGKASRALCKVLSITAVR